MVAKDTQVKKEVAAGERENRPLTKWQDSGPVVALSGYLKEHKERGVNLYETADGIPALRFSPGLAAADRGTDRWQISNRAVELLDLALTDLQQLLSLGLLTLPKKEDGHGNKL